ncbi:MAG TPA: hypothetical protein VGL66_19700 [Caulobacteraceae bacterium]
MTTPPTLICDTECFPNFWCAGFKRISDGKIVVLEKSGRSELDTDRLGRILFGHRTVGFNLKGYDLALLWAAQRGWPLHRLKELNDQIIVGRVPWWGVEDLIGFKLPRHDYIDLIEPQPNAIASLKTLNGRLHGRKMQDLPYSPDSVLSPDEMDKVVGYLGNDLDATELLFNALAEPLAMREAIGADIRRDLRSMSDTQVGFAILKARVEKMTGTRLGKPDWIAGKSFHYQVPPFIEFHTPALAELLDRIRTHRFVVGPKGKVELPDFLSKEKIAIGDAVYQLGIGGIHSTESARSVWETEAETLIDVDVGSYYPAIYLETGLYPPAMGPQTIPVYRGIRSDRMAAKTAKRKTEAEGLKIALNGGLFGNTSNPHSPAYAPQITIAITLTGQLALLMLIERAEAAGFKALSANTDGVTFLCPRAQTNPIEGVRLVPFETDDIPFSTTLKEITDRWERETGYDLEFVRYRSIHNLSVNSYFAIKEDGNVKRKGSVANPWNDPAAIRERLMKNPNMTVCSDAALAYIKDGVPVEDTIAACDDIRGFVTVVNVRGGGTWRGDYLGKVVRFIWAKDGEPIFYKTPHESTGNFKKVSKTEGARPMMTLDDSIPFELDYARYVDEAREILRDCGVLDPLPPPVKKPRGKAQIQAALLRSLIH